MSPFKQRRSGLRPVSFRILSSMTPDSQRRQQASTNSQPGPCEAVYRGATHLAFIHAAERLKDCGFEHKCAVLRLVTLNLDFRSFNDRQLTCFCFYLFVYSHAGAKTLRQQQKLFNVD